MSSLSFHNRIALGSAQWGLDYGISNNSGMTSLNSLKSILSLGRLNSINLIDTAQGYGDAEANLSRAGISDYDIVTKISLKSLISLDSHSLNEQLDNIMAKSFSNLGKDCLYGVLVHDANLLLESPQIDNIFSAFESLKCRFNIKKLGISIYSPNDLHGIMKYYIPDIVQVPFNVFDQRFAEKDIQSLFLDFNIEVHVRSIFLQGLLLMNKNEIPKYFLKWSSLITNWHTFCSEKRISSLEGCLSFASSFDFVDRIVIGINNSPQLEEILHARILQLDANTLSNLYVNDPNLINPSNWSL